MLRITTTRQGERTIFALEGRLAGPWVTELERCWLTTPVSPGEALCVDLTDVTYIDPDGKGLLARLHRDGAELIAAGCLTKCIVEEIARAGSFERTPHETPRLDVGTPRESRKGRGL